MRNEIDLAFSVPKNKFDLTILEGNASLKETIFHLYVKGGENNSE